MELSPSFRRLSLLVIFLLMLRALYLKEPTPRSNTNQLEKIRGSPVEKWMSQEVGVAQSILVNLQSAGVCVNAAHIPLCIKDILSNAKIANGKDPALLKLLQSLSPHGILGNHLLNEAKKKKQSMILSEWLRLNNLLSIIIEDQLQRNDVYSLEELSRFYAYTIKSRHKGHVEHINKVCESVLKLRVNKFC